MFVIYIFIYWNSDILIIDIIKQNFLLILLN